MPQWHFSCHNIHLKVAGLPSEQASTQSPHPPKPPFTRSFPFFFSYFNTKTVHKTHWIRHGLNILGVNEPVLMWPPDCKTFKRNRRVVQKKKAMRCISKGAQLFFLLRSHSIVERGWDCGCRWHYNRNNEMMLGGERDTWIKWICWFSIGLLAVSQTRTGERSVWGKTNSFFCRRTQEHIEGVFQS